MKLPVQFYLQQDVEQAAEKLLGCLLYTQIDGKRCSGRIVETEAYAGTTDRASHAWNGRRTKRTQVMYRPGGVAYVYLIYGIHALFNVVTNKQDIPHAVLIRAVEPVEGTATMLQRRNMSALNPKLSAGPGLLTRALGITTAHTGLDLQGNRIWIESGMSLTDDQIVAGPRIGVDYAGEDALLPRRFGIKDSAWLSRKF